MSEIILSNGQKVLVDESDFAFLNQWKWKPHKQGYACRSTWADGKSGLLLMHRAIIDAPKSKHVHHINEIKLDNRRCNLELKDPATHLREHSKTLVALQKSRQIYPDKKNCALCGKVFDVNPRKRKRSKCCSKECAQSMRVNGILKARAISNSAANSFRDIQGD